MRRYWHQPHLLTTPQLEVRNEDHAVKHREAGMLCDLAGGVKGDSDDRSEFLQVYRAALLNSATQCSHIEGG